TLRCTGQANLSQRGDATHIIANLLNSYKLLPIIWTPIHTRSSSDTATTHVQWPDGQARTKGRSWARMGAYCLPTTRNSSLSSARLPNGRTTRLSKRHSSTTL